MKKLSAILLLLLWGVVWGQKIPPKPVPPRLVNDLVGNVLEADQVKFLEEKLVAFDDSTSIQIAVVILPNLQDYEPVDFAVKLGREWGVGNKKTNNGVVILLSMEEGRRRVFIAPGYGLEGALPDITCKQIIENEVIPQFKQGNYFRGIDQAADAIIQASKGEYKAPAGYRNRGEVELPAWVFLVIIAIIILIAISSKGGGPGGGMYSRRGYRGVNGPIMWFPGGGSSGGSGWSGGGGGGFGGFGGGSFGGGGSGGSW